MKSRPGQVVDDHANAVFAPIGVASVKVSLPGSLPDPGVLEVVISNVPSSTVAASEIAESPTGNAPSELNAASCPLDDHALAHTWPPIVWSSKMPSIT